MPGDVEELIVRLNEQRAQLCQVGRYEQALDVARHLFMLVQQHRRQDHR